MRRLTILVDMDDTIEMLLEAWVKAVNEKYDRNATVDDVRSWDVSEAFPGLSRDEVYDVIMEDSFWDSVEPMPGAAEALKGFLDWGHRVFIVTATPYQSVRAKTEKVLFRYFPFITWDMVIVTSNKHLIRGDVLIDDGPHNLTGGQYRKILMSSPHNRGFDAASVGAVRCDGWDEAVRAVEAIEKEACGLFEQQD